MLDEDYLYLCIKYGNSMAGIIPADKLLFKAKMVVPGTSNFEPLFDDGSMLVSAEGYAYTALSGMICCFDAEKANKEGLTYVYDYESMRFVRSKDNN